MSTTDVLSAAQRLQAQQQPFALVSVLRVQAPASAKPGDKAVVTADGIVQGWIGGGCAQPAVLKTVRAALADGRARLMRIAPAEVGQMRELDEVLEFGMACHSGGTLELFVDPVLPVARLVVIGDTPLASALTSLAPHVGWAVQQVVDEAATRPSPDAFVVVATQGRRDLQGLRAALAASPRRIFFVASARKAAVLKAALVEAGEDAAAVAAIVAPAGQAIGAQTPQEIALSVLAAAVAARRGAEQAQPEPPISAATPAATPAAAAAPVAAPEVKPLPLPDLPPIGGSCCGGGG
jgi:xanthine dehydrogenase accessory factor